MRNLFCILALLIFGGAAMAHHGTGILFDLSMGPRAAGLGGAVFALSDDAAALLANPAALAWQRNWRLHSSYTDLYGAAGHASAILATRWASVGGALLSTGMIEPGLSYMVLGAAGAVAVPTPWNLSFALRGRTQRTVSPSRSYGWALDLAALWRGPVHIGVVWDAVWSADVVHAGGHRETWPQRVALGAALPLTLREPLSASIMASVEDIGNGPARASLGAELWISGIGLRAGANRTCVSFGVSARWRRFQLDWATILHQVLGTEVRGALVVSF